MDRADGSAVVSHDRAAQNWEGMVSSPRLDKFPGLDGLERWERETLKKLEAEQKARKQPLDIDDVRRVFSDVASPNMGELEREVLAGLALCLWGADHIEAARERKRRRESEIPFGSFVEVLHLAVYGSVEMGTGSPMPATVDENIKQREVARPNPARIGLDYMPAKQSRSGSTGGCRALGAVERRIDAKRALALSLLGPTEVWLLTALYCGEVEKWEKKLGGKLGKLTKRKRSELAEAYRKRICVGCEPPAHEAKPTKKRKPKGTGKSSPAESEQVREHAETCPAAAATDRAVSERITRARERLVTALVEIGLVPEPKSRTDAAKKKQKAQRVRIEPVRPGYSGRW